MEWILANLPILIFMFVVYSVVNAVKKAREKQAEHEASGGETAEQRRVREIQERIRRIAAERRGGRVPADMPPPPPRVEPPPAPPDPFVGPLKRMLEEIERRAQPVVPPPPPPAPPALPLPTIQSRRAAAERQEGLVEELRSAEETLATTKRRATQLAESQREVAATLGARRSVARANLLEELHDPESLRRAFLLREIIGPPVSLRR